MTSLPDPRDLSEEKLTPVQGLSLINEEASGKE